MIKCATYDEDTGECSVSGSVNYVDTFPEDIQCPYHGDCTKCPSGIADEDSIDDDDRGESPNDSDGHGIY